MSLRPLAAQHPVLAALSCAGAQFVLTTLILLAGSALAPPEAFGKVKLIAFASTLILPLLLVQALGLWRQIGVELDRVMPAPVFVVSLLACLPFLALGVHPQKYGSIGGEVVMQFLNAFGEELLFRGVIFAILLRLPRWQAIAISGILFGCMHLIHGFMDGNWNAALWWALATSVSGMMFAAVRYGTGSLWLVIILHMLLNLSKIYSNVELAAGPTVILVLDRLVNVFELGIAAYVVLSEKRRIALT